MRHSIPSLLAERPRVEDEEEKRRRLSPKREREKDRASGWWLLERCRSIVASSLTRGSIGRFKREGESSTEPVMWEMRCIYGNTVGRGETERVDVDEDERRGNTGVYHSSSRAKKKTESEQNQLQQKEVETTAKAPRGRNLLIPRRVHSLFRRIQSRRWLSHTQQSWPICSAVSLCCRCS